MNKYKPSNRNNSFVGTDKDNTFAQLSQSLAVDIGSKNTTLSTNKNDNKNNSESEKRRLSIQKVMGIKTKQK